MTTRLVYFTVGGDPGYVCLLKRCLESIKAASEDTCLSMIDFLVLCDEEYVPNVKDLGTLIHVTQKNADGIQASMRKTQIFQWPHIRKYEKVLYLDSDILVLEDIKYMFEYAFDPNCIYVVPERTFPLNPHNHIFFSLQDYSTEEMLELQQKGIMGFNCGQFMFNPSDEMQSHFENVCSLIANFKGEYFFEQSFMNRYFNTRCNLDYDHMEKHVQLSPKQYKYEQGKTIYHFLDAGCHYTNKLTQMNEYYSHVCIVRLETNEKTNS
jgi:lipopolysaccharide biosynthesis glycosyltransferase